MTTGSCDEPIAQRGSRCSALVVLSAAAMLLALRANGNPSLEVTFFSVVLPPAAWLMVAHEERAGVRVDPRLVVAAIGVLLVVAVVVPPGGSKDVWSYASYGRMISHYGVSPFTHVPAQFPRDPFSRLVGASWRHTPSVYGPLFVIIAAAGTQVAGTSMLVIRLFHQGLAASAVALALFLVWRETRSVAAIAFLGLNPLVIVNVVNNGHNDALVGLALLGAVLLGSRRRLALAGILLGAAALIKFTAALALPVLVVWSLWHYGWRSARSAAIGAAVTTGGAYLVAGTGAIGALGTNHAIVSPTSLWQVPRSLLGVGTRHAALGIGGAEWIGIFGAASIALVGVLALGAAWTSRRDESPARGATLALSAYLVAGLWVLPWYVMWAIPSACLTTDRRLRTFMISICALLPAVYAINAREIPPDLYARWSWFNLYAVPITLFGTLVAALVRRARSSSHIELPDLSGHDIAVATTVP